MNVLALTIGGFMGRLKPGPKVPMHSVDMDGTKFSYEKVGTLDV